MNDYFWFDLHTKHIMKINLKTEECFHENNHYTDSWTVHMDSSLPVES